LSAAGNISTRARLISHLAQCTLQQQHIIVAWK
jgi:hypothetical protein